MSWGLGLLKARKSKAVRRTGVCAEQSLAVADAAALGNSNLTHWTDVSLDDMSQVPGMTQPDELKYFYWCCATKHQPCRRVVELGPYVGRSTMAMAAGLRQSAEPNGKMVSVDRFYWEPWTLKNTLGHTVKGLSKSQRARLTPAQLNPKEDDSFLPFFEIFTEPLKDSIQPVNTWLESYRWTGEPIDVLMIDAAKSWDTFDQIIREFFPCLIDGAVVIHQDYKHFYTYWLHPVTERMLERGVLTLAENIEGNPTQGFRFHAKRNFRPEEYVRSAFSGAELDRLMARSAQRFRGDRERLALTGARCRFLSDQGKMDRAKAVFSEAMHEGGFADNYALDDLIMVAHDWARPITQNLLECATPPLNHTTENSGLRAVGVHSIAIPASNDGRPFVVEMPTLDTTDAAELAMNFWADWRGPEPLRIRIQAADVGSREPFYDDEFLMAPCSYQPAIVPLAGRSAIMLRWTTSCERPPAVAREIHCIAPMLIANAPT